MSDTVPDMGFRYEQPTDEDLPALSLLAYSVSARACGACRNYHVKWPYLRSIGVNGGGPERCWSISRDVIKESIAGRTDTRWLIAGAADAGVPALVRSCCLDFPDQNHTVTLIDRCETPLTVSRAYAAAVGTSIEVINEDLFTFSRDAAFDIVLFHYTFVFIDGNGRAELLRKARDWLAPRGQALIFLNYDRGDIDRAALSDAKRRWRRSIIERAVKDGELSLPEDLETFMCRVENSHDPARKSIRRLGWGLEDNLRAIREGGFTVKKVVDLPASTEETAAIGLEFEPRVVVVASASPSDLIGPSPK